MKGWQIGVLMIVVSIILSLGIYNDAKGSNILPWYVVLVDILMFLFGLVLIRFGRH